LLTLAVRRLEMRRFNLQASAHSDFFRIWSR
jgi:hypothetical protein